MDTTQHTPVILSLCPGIRGIERGLERVFQSIRVAAYVEIETFIIENLLTAMEAGLVDAAPVWTNLKTFNPGPFRNRIDGIIGGYPCQPFSFAGNRGGTTDPRHLYPFIENSIRIIRPKWCFFENVAGHLSLGFDTVSESLRAMGYNVEAGLYSAEEIGAPHQRKRLFILAIMADSASIEWGLSEPEGWIEGNEVAGGGQVVGNTEGNHKWREWESREAKRFKNRRSGAELENSLQHGINRGRNGNTTRCKCKIKAKGSGVGQADTCGEGLQGMQECHRPKGWEVQIGHSRGSSQVWPTGPGQQQHSWEAPRTIITEGAARLLGGYGKKHPEAFQEWQIDQVAFDDFTGTVKPELGCTIDGYNFREDLLRAFGNSVVEQTAELAFRDLLQKHMLKDLY